MQGNPPTIPCEQEHVGMYQDNDAYRTHKHGRQAPYIDRQFAPQNK